MTGYLLEVKNLKTYFYTEGKVIKAVDGIDFTIKEGETLGIVGESGSGKSVASLSLLQLIPSPPGKIVEGEVYFKGQNLLEKSENEMQKIRGRDISIVFQEPVSCLNPVMTVGRQISEAIKLHQGLNEKKAAQEAVEMLKLVKISSPKKRINQFPHELSGGMCQRVMIAIAIPISLSQIIGSLSTSVKAFLIPKSLEISGLSASTAMALYGKSSGMVMPLLFFPSHFIISLSSNIVPRISGAMANNNEHYAFQLAEHALTFASLFAFAVTSFFICLAEPIAQLTFRGHALESLIIAFSAGIPFFYVENVLMSILRGTGNNKTPENLKRIPAL
jgi:ABC-type dipeptide/oligopeptide/nickel transport system ATPase subunit